MKHFLISCPLIIFTLTMCETATAQKALYTGPLGIQAYTFRKSFPVNVVGTLDTIRMLGFTELEGGNGNNMTPQEFRKLCEERGITIPSTGANYEELLQHPDSVVFRTKALGAKYVVCGWIPHEKGLLRFEDARKAVEDFNRAGKYFKEHGLTFCYHTHGYEFQPFEDGTLLDYIVSNTDPRYVSFEMDVFWIQFGGGNPTTLLQKYGSRWKLIHLKDLKRGSKKDLTGQTDPNNDVPLGSGELEIPAILKQARKAGVRHYFIEDESSNVMNQLPQSIAYLKSLRE